MEAVDCCESIPLSGGTFPMGRSTKGTDRCPEPEMASGTCEGDELPEVSITLAPYELDRFEVTVGRFRAFFDAYDGKGLPGGAAPNLSIPDSAWEADWNKGLPTSKAALEADLSCSTNPHGATPMQATWTHTRGANENLPINCITWYEAFAFCAWDGGRLPTEAEWELAAANGAANDLYPWGEGAPTPALAVYDCTLEGAACRRPVMPAAVGSLPGGATRAGHRDLAGNVFEWTRDSISSYPTAPMTDYAYLTPGFYGFPVIRGGAFTAPAASLRAAARASSSPDASSPAVGVRCARNH
jgi:formylglycine-generating enzyme required for sulfatase activity